MEEGYLQLMTSLLLEKDHGKDRADSFGLPTKDRTDSISFFRDRSDSLTSFLRERTDSISIRRDRDRSDSVISDDFLPMLSTEFLMAGGRDRAFSWDISFEEGPIPDDAVQQLIVDQTNNHSKVILNMNVNVAASLTLPTSMLPPTSTSGSSKVLQVRKSGPGAAVDGDDAASRGTGSTDGNDMSHLPVKKRNVVPTPTPKKKSRANSPLAPSLLMSPSQLLTSLGGIQQPHAHAAITSYSNIAAAGLITSASVSKPSTAVASKSGTSSSSSSSVSTSSSSSPGSSAAVVTPTVSPTLTGASTDSAKTGAAYPQSLSLPTAVDIKNNLGGNSEGSSSQSGASSTSSTTATAISSSSSNNNSSFNGKPSSMIPTLTPCPQVVVTADQMLMNADGKFKVDVQGPLRTMAVAQAKAQQAQQAQAYANAAHAPMNPAHASFATKAPMVMASSYKTMAPNSSMSSSSSSGQMGGNMGSATSSSSSSSSSMAAYSSSMSCVYPSASSSSSNGYVQSLSMGAYSQLDPSAAGGGGGQLLLVDTYGDIDPTRVRQYTKEERQRRIERFREKKQKRIWRKQIKYDCRKRLADTRPRVKGRFVSRAETDDNDEGASKPSTATSSSSSSGASSGGAAYHMMGGANNGGSNNIKIESMSSAHMSALSSSMSANGYGRNTSLSQPHAHAAHAHVSQTQTQYQAQSQAQALARAQAYAYAHAPMTQNTSTAPHANMQAPKQTLLPPPPQPHAQALSQPHAQSLPSQPQQARAIINNNSNPASSSMQTTTSTTSSATSSGTTSISSNINTLSGSVYVSNSAGAGAPKSTAVCSSSNNSSNINNNINSNINSSISNITAASIRNNITSSSTSSSSTSSSSTSSTSIPEGARVKPDPGGISGFKFMVPFDNIKVKCEQDSGSEMGMSLDMTVLDGAGSDTMSLAGMACLDGEIDLTMSLGLGPRSPRSGSMDIDHIIGTISEEDCLFQPIL